MENEKDSNWKWGLFYYNPEDKRLFPPKKIPWMGWTINFANPLSIFVFILIGLGIFLFSRFIMHQE